MPINLAWILAAKNQPEPTRAQTRILSVLTRMAAALQIPILLPFSDVICNCPFQQFCKSCSIKERAMPWSFREVRPARATPWKVGRRKGRTRKRTHLERAGPFPFCHQRGPAGCGPRQKSLPDTGFPRNGIFEAQRPGAMHSAWSVPCRFGKNKSWPRLPVLDISP